MRIMFSTKGMRTRGQEEPEDEGTFEEPKQWQTICKSTSRELHTNSSGHHSMMTHTHTHLPSLSSCSSLTFSISSFLLFPSSLSKYSGWKQLPLAAECKMDPCNAICGKCFLVSSLPSSLFHPNFLCNNMQVFSLTLFLISSFSFLFLSIIILWVEAAFSRQDVQAGSVQVPIEGNLLSSQPRRFVGFLCLLVPSLCLVSFPFFSDLSLSGGK